MPEDEIVNLPATPVAARLEVTGRDLANAFKAIKNTKGVGKRKVFFEFRDGKAVIGIDVVRISIPASGVWPGVAEVSRTFIKTMATFDLASLPTIPIAYDAGRIMISDRSHECRWTAASSTDESR